MKLVLPALLRGVEDRQWRTKQGSIQLLGAMAYCAPRQLGTCLPTIVPRLSDVLSDPHPRVQSSARTALHEVNPKALNPMNISPKCTTGCVTPLAPALSAGGLCGPKTGRKPCALKPKTCISPPAPSSANHD